MTPEAIADLVNLEKAFKGYESAGPRRPDIRRILSASRHFVALAPAFDAIDAGAPVASIDLAEVARNILAAHGRVGS